MKTKITKYTCPVCNSPVWETISEDDSCEDWYTCYWEHTFTKDEFLVNKEKEI